jgi:C4-dicarboxylate-specific signal transduction histidine kinase
MLINLLRNAADAVLENFDGSDAVASESGALVTITWQLTEKDVILTIEDRGPGLMNPANAFVPFYTTKAQGSGIGLVLSRQICEAHGGSLELTNRCRGRGCVVAVALPRVSRTRQTLLSESAQTA